MNQDIKNNEIETYIENKEYIANMYVMKCFSVTMLVFIVAFLLNLGGIFTIEQKLMWKPFVISMLIYIILYITTRFVSLSNEKMKYFIMFCSILVFTITGIFITYHVILISLLPFLYATLYSSKPMMRFVYCLNVISTVIIVYGGYYYGLCDANMLMLTSGRVQEYVLNDQLIQMGVNPNPVFSLMLFFIIPRCLIYVAFMTVCRSIFNIVSGSVEKARLTTELEKAREKEEKANRAKSEFLAKFSHEIRTPINTVLGMNEMILRESNEKEIHEYASDVKEASLLLLNMLNDILDSTKVEAGRMEIINVNYEIKSLLNDLYHMTDIRAKEKGLNLIFDIDPSLPSGFLGDDKRVKQVLLNLLTNAIKYTKEGTVTLKVSGTKEGEKAFLNYSVADTGIGIKEEDIGRIYDAYFRFDVEINREIEGTGLGMNIVQQLLNLLGSELQIKSEYGKGSEFSFVIEQKIINEEPVGSSWKKSSDSKERKDYHTPFVSPNVKILVVDDYDMNLKVFKNLLKQTKIQVFSAESGKECLEQLKLQSFDMIFLDHMMPGLDGIETFRLMQENQLCEEIPVIMLTANTNVGERDRYIREGFTDFLSKPILQDKLDKMILKYLPTKCMETQKAEEMSVSVMSGEMLIQQLEKALLEIDFAAGIEICTGDKDFYLEILHDFTHLSIKQELERYLLEGDDKNYCIKIHGFKNSAYSVGAKKLGDLAYELEKGSKDRFSEEIGELQSELFKQYDRICMQYKLLT
ncbi:MAG: response regulator [Lachnospiraceae bacterium]|nr:response regulator [Lachnospiraceae bacterium]